MILKSARIVNSKKIIEIGWLKIEKDKIVEIQSGAYLGNHNDEIIDCQNQTIIPGFIDLHCHGGYGYSFMEPDSLAAALEGFSEKVLTEGTTSYLLGTVSTARTVVDKICQNLQKYLTFEQKYAEVLGVYLEGPFISSHHQGAHESLFLTKPNYEWIKNWNTLSANTLKVVAYAPEIDQNFGQFLIGEKIVPSFAHSHADYQETQTALAKGVNHVTHFYNAMTPFNHRHPGAILAILNHQSATVELICDGIHVDEEVLKFTYQTKKAEKIITVTDSVMAKGQPDGTYKLGPLSIYKEGQKVTLQDGETIAGSVSTMITSFQRWLKITNEAWVDCVKMTSFNAAQLLKLTNIGDLQKDYQADLVVLDQKQELLFTIKKGKIVFTRKEVIRND